MDKAMESFGWLSLSIGVLILMISAVFEVGESEANVMNLAGTLVGSTLMICGAIFISGARIEDVVRRTQDHSAPPVKKVSDGVPSKFVIGVAVIMVIAAIMIFLSNPWY